MKSMLEELKDVKIKKHTVTSIEYDCKSEEKEDAVFDQVHNIVTVSYTHLTLPTILRV